MLADLLPSLKRAVPKEKRPALYRALIREFENHDCDTLCEIEDREFRKVYEKLYPADDELDGPDEDAGSWA